MPRSKTTKRQKKTTADKNQTKKKHRTRQAQRAMQFKTYIRRVAKNMDIRLHADTIVELNSKLQDLIEGLAQTCNDNNNRYRSINQERLNIALTTYALQRHANDTVCEHLVENGKKAVAKFEASA